MLEGNRASRGIERWQRQVSLLRKALIKDLQEEGMRELIIKILGERAFQVEEDLKRPKVRTCLVGLRTKKPG